MRAYKTVNEVKRHLPEIVDRISTCKKLFNGATLVLREIEKMCMDKCEHPEYDYGEWTTLEKYAEVYKSQMRYYAEIEYLQGLLDRLPDYKEQNT